MARIPLETLVARSAQIAPENVRVDTGALAAPGRALSSIGDAITAAGDVLGKKMQRDDDIEIQRALSQFDYESDYIKQREAALRDGTIAGFHDRTALSYDSAVSSYIGGIENRRVREAVERRLLAARPGYLSDAAKAEEGVLTRESDSLRDTRIAEAVASFDYSARFLEQTRAPDANDTGFAARINDDYLATVDAYVANITDPTTREAVRRQLLGRAHTYTSAAATRQYEEAGAAATVRQNTALQTITNRVRTDPLEYAAGLEDGFRVIDAMPISDADKAAMQAALRNDLANARFDSQIASAASPEELDAIEAELRQPRWQTEFTARDYDAMLDRIRVSRAGGREAMTAQARASVAMIEGRIQGGYPVSPEELATAEADARASGDAGLQWRVAEAAAQNAVYQAYGTMPLPVLRAEISRRQAALTRDGGGSGQGLPPELASAVATASSQYGVSASFLSGLAFFEYEMHFRPGAGETDYTHGTADGTTSAAGPYQFTRDTWLSVIQANPGAFPEAAGLDEAGVLALRGDPDIAARGAALSAARNRGLLRSRLGREPTEAELVAAHFLGVGGASSLIEAAAADPTQDATALFPTPAANNPGIFKRQDGTNRTVGEVMDRIAERSVGRTGRLGYVELEALEKLAARLETGVSDDMMATAGALGVVALTDLVEDGFTEGAVRARGERALYVARYYGIPADNWTPLTEPEVQALSAKLQAPDTTVDEKLRIAEVLQGMGDDMAAAAFRQIGAEDPVFSYSAGLMAATGDRQTARTILRGQRRLAETANAFEGQVKEADLRRDFATFAGQALSNVRDQESVFAAAMAHYAETRTPGSGYSQRDFQRSIDAVIGGRIEDVNGASVPLQGDLTADEVEDFLDGMSYGDMVALSVNGEPPRLADGSVPNAVDLEGDLQLEALGGGQYRVRVRGGGYLATGENEDGTMQAYIMRLDPARIQAAAAARAAAKAAEEAARAAARAAEVAAEKGLTDEAAERAAGSTEAIFERADAAAEAEAAAAEAAAAAAATEAAATANSRSLVGEPGVERPTPDPAFRVQDREGM